MNWCFESGVTAKLMGTVTAVVFGGSDAYNSGVYGNHFSSLEN
jgi:hypothetical protein